MNAEEVLIRVAVAHLGPCRIGRDLSWEHGESVVREIVSAAGTAYIGKRHRRAEKFSAELHAYTNWVPALRDRAPLLVGVDEASQVLILTKVGGKAVSGDGDGAVHHAAGRLLRRFHDAASPRPGTDYVESERRRLAQWIDRARPGLLQEEEMDTAHQALGLIAAAPEPDLVPCHCDWQPRNWLVDDRGLLYAIDFEQARLWPWYSDLARLWWGEWSRDPSLADAFFEGYGRRLNDDERRCLLAASTMGHLITIVWADEHGDIAFGAAARRHLAQARQ